MRLKSILGLIGALLPIAYCGGLIYYFLDVSGSVHDANALGLGPTVLGLAIVGLLFCIPLIVKVMRIIALRPHAPSGSGGRDASTQDAAEFDADATLARYMARRSAEAASSGEPAPPTDEGGASAARASFGRRVK